MKLFAPKYYALFSCVAEKCRHTCCAGWEIDIDNSTMNQYKALSVPYSDVIKNSITNTDPPHFILQKYDRCPHLDDNGLCNIIKELGDDYLCDICREHPRFYNYTNKGKEVGIGISCEEACRIVLNSDDFDLFDMISEDEEPVEMLEFDPTENRERIFKMLKLDSLSFDEKIGAICGDYAISLDAIDFGGLLDSLDYLDSDHRSLFSCDNYVSTTRNHEELIRLLAYFIYRHASESFCMEDLRASIGLSLVLTLIVSAASEKLDIYDVARIVSKEIEYSEENTELIKSYFV